MRQDMKIVKVKGVNQAGDYVCFRNLVFWRDRGDFAADLHHITDRFHMDLDIVIYFVHVTLRIDN